MMNLTGQKCNRKISACCFAPLVGTPGLEHKHKCSKSKRHQPRFFEEYQCIVCGELYEDPPKEDWIQCHKCEDWSHENCTDYRGNGFYKCDLCTKFVSD